MRKTNASTAYCEGVGGYRDPRRIGDAHRRNNVSERPLGCILSGLFREIWTGEKGREPPVGRDQYEAPFQERLMDTATRTERPAVPWNKGKLLGQKPPLQLKEIWASQIRLQLDH